MIFHSPIFGIIYLKTSRGIVVHKFLNLNSWVTKAIIKILSEKEGINAQKLLKLLYFKRLKAHKVSLLCSCGVEVLKPLKIDKRGLGFYLPFVYGRFPKPFEKKIISKVHCLEHCFNTHNLPVWSFGKLNEKFFKHFRLRNLKITKTGKIYILDYEDLIIKPYGLNFYFEIDGIKAKLL